MKFYELPGQDLNEDLEQIHDESVDKTVATYSPELQPQKSAKTYRRHRLNTFPQVSMKKLRSPHQHFSPRSVYERWLRTRARGKTSQKHPQIDTLPSISSSIVEPQPGVEEDFGELDISQLSWDHTSDVNTPSYDDEPDDDLSRVAKQVALNALSEIDDVFEDVQLFDDVPGDHNIAMMEDRNQLDLIGDFAQPGRVYRLDNRLAVSTDKILIKQKRLVGSTSSSTADMPKKKKIKQKSKIRWFVKKLVFSKKPPNGEDDDPPPSQEVT